MAPTTAVHTAPTIIDLVVPDLLEDYTDCEVTDPELVVLADGPTRIFPLGTAERVSIALPGSFGTYLRVKSSDLAASIDGLRRLLDRIEYVVLDAREERREAAMVPCPFCPARIDPDEHTCGSAPCERLFAREALDDMHDSLDRARRVLR